MDIRKARALLVGHPRLFAQKCLGRIARGLPRGLAPSVRRRRGVSFQVPLGDDPRLREMGWGVYEPETVHLMESHLGPGDVFIDIGANLGYLTAVGAGLVGPEGEVHAFEPVPRYFERLAAFCRLNPDHTVIPQNFALGARRGTARIAVGEEANLGWNTMVPGFMGPPGGSELEVPVERLDTYLQERGLREIDFIKIDVEGFELPVLLGLEGFLAGGGRPPILCEVAPGAYSLLGRKVEDLFDYMAGFSYRAREPIDAARRLEPRDVGRTMNVLFEAA